MVSLGSKRLVVVGKSEGDIMSLKTEKLTRKRGRPEKSIPRIDASPEQVARAMFAAAMPVDPKLRKVRKKRGERIESSVAKV